VVAVLAEAGTGTPVARKGCHVPCGHRPGASPGEGRRADAGTTAAAIDLAMDRLSARLDRTLADLAEYHNARRRGSAYG